MFSLCWLLPIYKSLQLRLCGYSFLYKSHFATNAKYQRFGIYKTFCMHTLANLCEWKWRADCLELFYLVSIVVMTNCCWKPKNLFKQVIHFKIHFILNTKGIRSFISGTHYSLHKSDPNITHYNCNTDFAVGVYLFLYFYVAFLQTDLRQLTI